MQQPLQTATNRVYMRGDPDYKNHCYQYGSSSNEGIVQPAAIIYAANDDDVIKAIKYAKTNKIAVAVRTGGHQYCGASSTFGNNIQLDLSRTYLDVQWETQDFTLVTVGISLSLGEFNDILGKKNRFVPHGQCSHVHLGGHVQSGGYGQLGRSFGLLADQVQKFRIITADGIKRWVRRGVPEDKDLFFAVLGGSPGNFGVLTHVTLKVYRDEDHPNSRGLRAQYLYSRDRLKRLLDVMVDMVDDNDFPGDYDYCVSVVSSCCLLLPWFTPGMDTEDERMRRLHPELFGVDKQFLWPKTILVYAQWANLGGAQQQYNPEFFNKIKAAGGIPLLGVPVDDDVHRNMSELTNHWTWQNSREFDLPYIRRAGFSNSTTLRADGWTDWVSDRIDLIQSDAFNECKVAVQIQPYGGSNSQTFKHRLDGDTSISWRDSNILCGLDCFHFPDAKAKATAEQWQAGNDAEGVGHPNAKFCVEDRRLLSFSHDLDLDPVHKHYYDDDPAKYRRLCDIKRYWDPERVFTPNAFCVGGILNPVRTPNLTLIDDRQMAPKL
ncbi:hypothetical protein BG003_009013 [Podila horticola]|nr:hypothetical protein BG003_009013 [Podila horticola]